MIKYLSRAKSLALNIQYHDTEVTDPEISRRVLNGLPPAYAPEKQNFALRINFSLGDLEDSLVRVEELNRSSDGTDGSYVLAAGFKAKSGSQSGQSGGRESRNGSGRGKHDGKSYPVKSAAAATTAVSAAVPAKAARASAATTAASAAN